MRFFADKRVFGLVRCQPSLRSPWLAANVAKAESAGEANSPARNAGDAHNAYKR